MNSPIKALAFCPHCSTPNELTLDKSQPNEDIAAIAMMLTGEPMETTVFSNQTTCIKCGYEVLVTYQVTACKPG